MTDLADPRRTSPQGAGRASTPHRTALIVGWLVTVTAMVTMLVAGVRHTDRYEGVRAALHVAYVMVLLWYVTRDGARFGDLPGISYGRFLRSKVGRLVPVLVLVLLLFLSGFSDDGLDIVMTVLLVATPWVLVAWYKGISLRAVLLGLVLTVLALLGGAPAWRNGFLSNSVLTLLGGFALPMFVGGVLLIQHTGLGGVSSFSRGFGNALRSFLTGCLLFVPLGLVNAVGGSPGSDITWVDRGWMPITLPAFSGITEEILFRLFLIGLCYYLLRPALRQPAVAVAAAALFGATVFGLGHGRDMGHFLVTGMLYGFPMAWLFVKRDWEHSVGAHYMVNMIPWLMVFLER